MGSQKVGNSSGQKLQFFSNIHTYIHTQRENLQIKRNLKDIQPNAIWDMFGSYLNNHTVNSIYKEIMEIWIRDGSLMVLSNYSFKILGVKTWWYNFLKVLSFRYILKYFQNVTWDLIYWNDLMAQICLNNPMCGMAGAGDRWGGARPNQTDFCWWQLELGDEYVGANFIS